MSQRVRNLQESLKLKKLDYFLIDSYANRLYLTGLESTAGFVLIPQTGTPTLFVDSRYYLKAKKITADLEIVEYENFYKQHWNDFATRNKGLAVGFEAPLLSVEKLKRLKKFGKGLKLIPTQSVIEEIRSLKDSGEVRLIKQALKISDLAFAEIKKIIKVGMTEKEVAWKLERIMRELGADKNAWEPLIIAAGKNSALPHHGQSNTKIKAGDLVQLDFGCVVGGYHTDTSRVLFMGAPTDRQVEIYSLVLEAQKKGISQIKPGVTVGKIDQDLKEWLGDRTRGVYKHGLGHGVGLEIHELPTLGSGVTTKLAVGQLVTVEPGIYIENWGGVRIEDIVLVVASGHQVLTKAPKKLEESIIHL